MEQSVNVWWRSSCHFWGNFGFKSLKTTVDFLSCGSNRRATNFSSNYLQLSLRRGVDFPDLIVDNGRAINPWIAIFTEQPVAAHDVAFDKAMLADGLKHIIRTGRFVMASRAIDS